MRENKKRDTRTHADKSHRHRNSCPRLLRCFSSPREIPLCRASAGISMPGQAENRQYVDRAAAEYLPPTTPLSVGEF